LLGRDRLSEPELAAWLRAVEGRRAWWREHGADYLFVIAPNKSTIYPEKLPAFLQTHRRAGKLDQLLEYFTAHNVTVPFIDLRTPLQAAKGQDLVYWPTDSHWSAEGLVVSCDAIMARLHTMGVPHRVRDENSWLKRERLRREGDCIGLLIMNGRWPIEPITQLRLVTPPDLRATQTPLTGLPVLKSLAPWAQPTAFERDSGVGRAVMLCDSFFWLGGMAGDMPAQSPLVLNFRRFVSVWSWLGAHNVATYDTLAAIAQLERPTLVIEQWTERYLRTPPPDHPEFQRARAAAIESRRSASNSAQSNGSR